MGSTPTEIVSALDAFLRYFASAAMVTLLVGVLDKDLETFRYVAAGHVPPLVVAGPATKFATLDHADPPLGRAKVHTFRERTLALERGTSLVLYTDGLVERRGESLDVGLDRLATLARELVVERDPNEALLAIVSGVLPHDPTDDAAIMLVHRYARVSNEFSIGMRAEARSLTSIRRSVSAWLGAHDVPRGLASEIVTAVSEACLNVVEHAYGPSGGIVRVVATYDRPTITVEVIDTGEWRDAPSRDRGRGFLLMRGLMDDVEVVEEDAGTVVRMRKGTA
jgi:anti-sigma regulatory factor (Ser/Thr protein kinase)